MKFQWTRKRLKDLYKKQLSGITKVQARSQKFAMGRAVPWLMAKEQQKKKEYIWIWNDFSIEIQMKAKNKQVFT